ncbi:NAD(P)H-hydrate dehydratase [Thermanaerovibrio velox]|uniref:NAD(P)H-hydrate dehydratase n=1 Tax=Thermanaerovibrio velox TaxID=108007 RepID=UPI0002D25A2E
MFRLSLSAYDPNDVRLADQKAVQMGIPGEILMENAGAGAARAIIDRFGAFKKAVVLCGPGNNGGDGMVVARHLLTAGVDVAVVSTTSSRAGDSLGAERMYLGAGGRVFVSSEFSDRELLDFIRSSNLLVDGLLGTGSGGPPRGEVLRLIRLAGDAGVPVVSLDIPTGFDGRTGALLGDKGDFLSASLTVSFMALKSGLFFTPAFDSAGSLEVVPIGVPPCSVLPEEPAVTAIFPEDLPFFKPRLGSGYSKADRGMVLVIGGSDSFGGAPFLSALGALCAGAGWVVCGVPEKWSTCYAPIVPEAMIEPLPVDSSGSIVPEAYEHLMSRYGDKVKAIVLGPGLGRSEGAIALVGKVLSSWEGPLVLDADGLNAFSALGMDCSCVRSKVWITPHEGEAARLLGKSSSWIRGNRRDAAEALGKCFDGVLLKGRNSVLVFRQRMVVCCIGDPNMSIPGSGDVLSGIMGAIFARAGWSMDSAIFAVGLHAMAGQSLALKGRGDGILARHLADEVALVLGGMYR